jgi:ElaB/YqjD/DUF883 family membrane-anchored ribosome-binding protein
MTNVADRTDIKDQANEAAAGLKQRAEQEAGHVAEKLQGVSSDAMEKAEAMQDQATDRLASGLEHASEYVRGTDAAAVRDDLSAWVKKHPMQALAVGVFTGFIAARVLH